MFKTIKLNKLKKEYEKHRDIAMSLARTLGAMLRNSENATKEGEQEWQNCMRQFNIHMNAWTRLENEYNKLNSKT